MIQNDVLPVGLVDKKEEVVAIDKVVGAVIVAGEGRADKTVGKS